MHNTDLHERYCNYPELRGDLVSVQPTFNMTAGHAAQPAGVARLADRPEFIILEASVPAERDFLLRPILSLVKAVDEAPLFLNCNR